MDTLHRFLGMYEEQAERLDATLMDTSEEMDQVQARIEAIEKEIHEIELKQDEHLARYPREAFRTAYCISSFEMELFESLLNGGTFFIYVGEELVEEVAVL
ncbi:hypothetical protein X801_10531 [Opisthorchis viverrini]|uniref:Uncharacterized protein n=1 Tax=Opisthorchis viverrini TaxID=6198 RepID=A0A1S8WGW6_OPIVI|nr:hypothetical protein X801_10531 [Opisthorchis viverrini]